MHSSLVLVSQHYWGGKPLGPVLESGRAGHLTTYSYKIVEMTMRFLMGLQDGCGDVVVL